MNRTTPVPPPLLQWHDLTCQYDGRTLFAPLTGTLNVGQRLHLQGPSGTGKTSLLNCFLGFVTPASGTYTATTRMTLVPQEAEFGAYDTVLDAIYAPFDYRANQAARPTHAAIAALTTALNLPQALLCKPLTTLSGGEKQRLAILIALLLPCDILLLDEPFSALDPANCAAVEALLMRQHDRAIIFVSHIIPTAGFTTDILTLTPPGGAQ